MSLRSRARAIVLFSCSLVVGSLIPAQPVAAQNLTFEEITRVPAPAGARRFSYGSDPSQFGELRLPPGKGPYPVVVVIHGGCWYSQYDLSHLENFNASLTKLGVAAARKRGDRVQLVSCPMPDTSI